MDFLTHHMLQSSARRTPEKEALVHGDERLSYKEVAGRVSGVATGLRRSGVNRGDRVGIYLDASVPQVLSIFGISEAGGVFVPVNAALFPEQVLHIARDCGMTALITSEKKLESLAEVLPQIPSLKFVVLVGKTSSAKGHASLHSFEEFCGLKPSGTAEDSISKDLAAILYTSGSTGKPKGVMLSHANIMAGSSIVSKYLGITASDRI